LRTLQLLLLAIAVALANCAAAVFGYFRGALGNSAAYCFWLFPWLLRTVMLLLLAIAVALAHVLLSLLAIACPLAYYCWRLLTRFAHCAAVVVGDCLRSC
jgi:hypothetical protein